MSGEKDVQVAEKISQATRRVEDTAAQVVRKTAVRTVLTDRVSDSAAELADYILKRARKAG